MDVYHLFAQRGLTRSRHHFFAEWLGAAPIHLALRGGRALSTDVLVALFQRLWRRGDVMLATRVAWMILWPPKGARV
jgi:hypothetical protein